jgi:hypothetical protein
MGAAIRAWCVILIFLRGSAHAIEADGRSLSASLVAAEFHADGSGTHLVPTEQLAYLDGQSGSLILYKAS